MMIFIISNPGVKRNYEGFAGRPVLSPKKEARSNGTGSHAPVKRVAAQTGFLRRERFSQATRLVVDPSMPRAPWSYVKALEIKPDSKVAEPTIRLAMLFQMSMIPQHAKRQPPTDSSKA